MVQRQLDAAGNITSFGGIAWGLIRMGTSVFSGACQVLSQGSVLLATLQGQLDGPLLATLCIIQTVVDIWSITNKYNWHNKGVWAATTANNDYIRVEGLKRIVGSKEYRKELVAGNLADYCISGFRNAIERVGTVTGDFASVMREYQERDGLTLLSLLREPWQELPQIIFTIRAVQYPASVPVSLASLHLIQQTTSDFGFTMFRFMDNFGSIAEQLSKVRNLYDIATIQNRVQDGTVPFPEDTEKLKSGIAIEFRNVSFRYPETDKDVLRNVSFKVSPGQLCVIVGANGSGKSTILKLIVRLYDVQGGMILVNGQDIRMLKLAGLRQAISVLFQDYTHFPLSIRENIALGKPSMQQAKKEFGQLHGLGVPRSSLISYPTASTHTSTAPSKIIIQTSQKELACFLVEKSTIVPCVASEA
ncbi:hypothetical protein WOLCODRAFT_159789 [Wolfiporia cocos MD-104 SS10]|uniref:AAA+ ATPase domain-containing protein n=1 Tax=Wolfiporia cocos (strain MD-104) TaxID=742152 RepID=A0A2H3J8P1_WOLCO|nr:hypothetical protein WOLCODRAFT_159789 [Wolfiporia cocos MD-104 SS10]